MNSLPVRKAQDKLNQLVEQVSEQRSPILINGSGHDAVLIAKADWDAIQESLYLNSIPDLVASIHQGSSEAMEDCVELENLAW